MGRGLEAIDFSFQKQVGSRLLGLYSLGFTIKHTVVVYKDEQNIEIARQWKEKHFSCLKKTTTTQEFKIGIIFRNIVWWYTPFSLYFTNTAKREFSFSDHGNEKPTLFDLLMLVRPDWTPPSSKESITEQKRVVTASDKVVQPTQYKLSPLW